MTSLSSHPQRNSIRLQLRQQPVLQGMSPAQWAEIEPQLVVADYRKGDPLVRQGDEEMEQFFILEGMLKRVVSNPEGREMILRFAAESFLELWIPREVRSQDLDGHFPAQAHIVAVVDLRHASIAERIAQFVAVGEQLGCAHLCVPFHSVQGVVIMPCPP